MTISDFISRACEGGWRKEHNPIPDSVSSVRFETESGMRVYWSFQSVVLDPSSWQAIGEVEGWNKQCDDCGRMQANGENCSAGGTHDYGEYRYRMHRFIDFLCDGLTLEEALKRATS